MYHQYPLSPESDVVQTAFSRIPIIDRLACGLSGKRVLITGGTGFFGKWLLALLYFMQKQGADFSVVCVSRNPHRFLAAHPEYAACAWLHWQTGDVRTLLTVGGQPFDFVLHAATDTSQQAHTDPLLLFETIVQGARQILDITVRSGAQRILFTGSGAQYGQLLGDQPVAENSLFACNSALSKNVYAEAKRAQEMLAMIYAQQASIQPILTRCFAFSGPGLPLNGHFAIGNFIYDAMCANSIMLSSLGLAMRSYLHGADLSVWLLFLLLYGESGEVYNVGSDVEISVADLARRVVMRLAPSKPIIFPKSDDGNKSYYIPNIEKARSLGLDVWSSLDISIDDMACWVRSNSLAG